MGTRAAKKVNELHLEKAQHDLDHVQCEGEDLKNVFVFKYLGSLFTASGDQSWDVRRRIGMAEARMGTLRHVFNADINFHIKMKVYKTAVCSLLTYGSEAWSLDKDTQAKINGCNARMLSRFTNKDAHQEASARTRS